MQSVSQYCLHRWLGLHDYRQEWLCRQYILNQVVVLFCLYSVGTSCQFSIIFTIKNASRYIVRSFPCYHYCRNKKVKRIGPRMSPCFTPLSDPIVPITSWTVNFTLKSCNALNGPTSFFGIPHLVSIIHDSSLGTRSKVLTRWGNNTHDSKPCSLRFLMAVFMVKIASMQPLPGRNPHCRSWSNYSMILYAISRSMIPR